MGARVPLGASDVRRSIGPVSHSGDRVKTLLSGLPIVGVSYDEHADTAYAVGKYGQVIVAHGIPGLRL